MPTCYEFFAGGGMARAGLGPGWSCLLANESDHAKAKAYEAAWGRDHLAVCDVAKLATSDLPGRADLAWASPPCQDFSLAGGRRGAEGVRSGALWPWLDLVRRLSDEGRAPRLVAIENVVPKLSASGGRDFAGTVGSLASSGYRVGAMVVDAVRWLPQSRSRLVIVAASADLAAADGFAADGPEAPWHPAQLADAVAALPPAVRAAWRWWRMPEQGPCTLTLADLIDWDTLAPPLPKSVRTCMADRDLARLEAARRAGRRLVASVARRTRPGPLGGEQRYEVRFDGIAGCLRTAGGGSSHAAVVTVNDGRVGMRTLSPREAARLMGLPETYPLPASKARALRLLGDGVAVPVVRHLARHLFEPMLAGTEGGVWAPPRTVTAGRRPRPGIKGATTSTSVYLLPGEAKRLKRLALDLDVTLQELLLRGADRLLAEAGQRAVQRYRPDGGDMG